MKNLLCIFALLSGQITLAQDKGIPQLETREGMVHLMVDNEPFLMLAGELHNSSAGSAHYMRPIWSRLAEQNLNTVIAPVSWELVEPHEGVFDFSLVDSMITGARKENLKLVIIWFASWKNGMSTYAPEWVKTDNRRFPMVKDRNGNTMNILSTFGRNTLEADANAFAQLMEHIREVDANEHTVLMVQVENEVGVLSYMLSYGGGGRDNPYNRDYNDAANKAFNGQVPEALIDYLNRNRNDLHPALEKAWADQGYRQKGTWEEVFGKGEEYNDIGNGAGEGNVAGGRDWKTTFPYYTEEIFMAWNYATYMGEIAKQGKEKYALPMYVNTWLKQQRSAQPGAYPSGGPLPHVIDIWRAAAPAIDFIAPDIYMVEEFDWVCQEFTRSGNPLFIPETEVGAAGAARALYAFGKYDALGYSPFGIDGGGIFNSASPEEESLKKVYGCLKDLMPVISTYRGTDKMTALLINGGKNAGQVEMGDYIISARELNLSGTFGVVGAEFGGENTENENMAAVIIIQLQENEFLIAGGVGGMMVSVSKGLKNKWDQVGIASVDEISFQNGEMRSHRLNGDETVMAPAVIRPGEVRIFKIKMYGYD